MKNSIKGIFLTGSLIISAFFGQQVNAQEVQFSQFYASSLYLNPAFAGMESDYTFNSNVRSQWGTLGNAQVTTQLSGIMPLFKGMEKKTHTGGIGVSIFNNQAGAGSIRETGFRATGAWSRGFQGELHKISIGGQLGLTQMAVDPNLQFPGQFNGQNFDANIPVNLPGFRSAFYYPVFNAGVMYSFNPGRNYYRAGTSGFAGLSVSNINQPRGRFFEGADGLAIPTVTKAHGGLELHVNRKFNFGPQLLVAYQNGFGTQINAGVYANYRIVDNPFGMFGNSDLIAGVWHRLEDSFIFSLGISNATYTLGFSYDMTTSNLNTFNQGLGAYEVSFAIRNAKDKRRRRFDTPRI